MVCLLKVINFHSECLINSEFVFRLIEQLDFWMFNFLLKIG